MAKETENYEIQIVQTEPLEDVLDISKKSTAKQAQNYQIRRVTSEDKEDVLEIDKNYLYGNDFLPAYYDTFLYMPNAYPVAMVCDDKIVGYIVAHIVDGGQTAVIRGARVSPDHRGRSLLWHLFLHVADWAYKKGVNSIVEVSRRPPNHLTKRVLFVWDYTTISLEPQNLLIGSEDVILARDLATVSDEILFDLFRDGETKDYLAPKGFLLTYMFPYKPIEENLYCMRGIDGCANIYSDVNVSLRGRNGLMSCLSRFRSPAESSSDYVHCLDIYGNDTRSLRKHLVRHLLDLREKSGGAVSMYIVIPEHISFGEIFQIFSQCYLGFNKKKQCYPINQKVYLKSLWSRETTQHSKL